MDQSPFTPEFLREYDVRAEIDAGGMATVYRAYHRGLDRDCAVKLFQPSVFDEDDALQRFLHEGKITARLNHPHIVQVYSIGKVGSTPYIALELVEGSNLKVLVKKHPRGMPAAKALPLVLQIADALGCAHAHGIVHRDLKPENVLLTEDGQAKVADFGLAKTSSGDAVRTRTGIILGTPYYMAPEQINADPLGPATDQYALGVMLFELLSGTPPFQGENDLAILLKHTKEPPPSLAEYVSSVPPELDGVIHRMMAKKPEERFPDLAAAATVLEEILRNFPALARRAVNARRRPSGKAPLSAFDRSRSPTMELSGLNTSLGDDRSGLGGAVPPPRHRPWLLPLVAGTTALLLIAATLRWWSGRSIDESWYRRKLVVDEGRNGVSLAWESGEAYPSRVELSWSEGERRKTQRHADPSGESRKDHRLRITGLEGGRSYELRFLYPGDRRSAPVPLVLSPTRPPELSLRFVDLDRVELRLRFPLKVRVRALEVHRGERIPSPAPERLDAVHEFPLPVAPSDRWSFLRLHLTDAVGDGFAEELPLELLGSRRLGETLIQTLNGLRSGDENSPLARCRRSLVALEQSIFQREETKRLALIERLEKEATSLSQQREGCRKRARRLIARDHLSLFESETGVLGIGPLLKGFRPRADAFFRSAELPLAMQLEVYDGLLDLAVMDRLIHVFTGACPLKIRELYGTFVRSEGVPPERYRGFETQLLSLVDARQRPWGIRLFAPPEGQAFTGLRVANETVGQTLALVDLFKGAEEDSPVDLFASVTPTDYAETMETRLSIPAQFRSVKQRYWKLHYGHFNLPPDLMLEARFRARSSPKSFRIHFWNELDDYQGVQSTFREVGFRAHWATRILPSRLLTDERIDCTIRLVPVLPNRTAVTHFTALFLEVL